MTESEFQFFFSELDRIKAGVADFDSWRLTKGETAALRAHPDIVAAVEEHLARYTPMGADMRPPVALKTLSRLLLALPLVARAYKLGYRAGGTA